MKRMSLNFRVQYLAQGLQHTDEGAENQTTEVLNKSLNPESP